MSVTTSLVDQFVRKQSTTDPADSPDSTDAASGGVSLSEIKAAAKEGTAEALSEYAAAGDDTDVTTTDHDSADGGSRGTSSLKRVFLVVVFAVYVLRRWRSRRSRDAQ